MEYVPSSSRLAEPAQRAHERQRDLTATTTAPPSLQQYALMLQRTAGNQATTALVQRWIKFRPDTPLNAEWAADKDLDDVILKRYTEWVGRKKISPDTATAIRAKVKAWILDADEHANVGGKYFMKYEPIFEMARAQVGGAAPLLAPPDLFEMPDAAPLSPSHTPMDAGDMNDAIPTFRRAASVVRELGPQEVDDDEDEDRADRRRSRRQDYVERVEPRLRSVPYHRRKRDMLGTVSKDTEPFRLGPFAYELQGGSSHRMTKQGGGSAPPYAALITQLQQVAAPLGDQQIATKVRELLENGTLPDLSEPGLRCLAEMLAVVQGPEMSRASVAANAFAAAMHWVAEGNGTLTNAFVGGGAVYLGANKGGAAALRGNLGSLSATKRAAMESQVERAELVIAAWATRFTDANLQGDALQARLSELHQQVLTNMQRFVAMLEQRAAAPDDAVPAPDLPDDGGDPGGPPAGSAVASF